MSAAHLTSRKYEYARVVPSSMSSSSEETRSGSTLNTSGEARGPGRTAEPVCPECVNTDDVKKRCQRCHYLVQCKKHTAAYRLRKKKGSKAPTGMTRNSLIEKCAQQQQRIGALHAEVERLSALLRSSLSAEQERHHASSGVAVPESGFPPLELIYSATSASTVGTRTAETGHQSVCTPPAGNFGPAPSAYASASSGASVIGQAASRSHYDRGTVEEALDLEEANRQSRYTAVAMQQSLSSSWLVLAVVDIRYVVTIDEYFQRTGKMFRILESFHHLALYIIDVLNMNYGYRYLHPENVVLSPAPLRSTSYYAHLPNNECTAYCSKLSKTFALRNVDEPQYLPYSVPHCYAFYAAPEVLAGQAVDLRKATAYSFGVMLYEALGTMPGIDHIVTNCDCEDIYGCRLYSPEFGRMHHFIRESTHIHRVDSRRGHISTGLFSVNPAIISVIKGLLRPDPLQRFPLERFAQLFARTSNYQFDTTVTGAKALDTTLPVVEYASSLR